MTIPFIVKITLNRDIPGAKKDDTLYAMQLESEFAVLTSTGKIFCYIPEKEIAEWVTFVIDTI